MKRHRNLLKLSALALLSLLITCHSPRKNEAKQDIKVAILKSKVLKADFSKVSIDYVIRVENHSPKPLQVERVDCSITVKEQVLKEAVINVTHVIATNETGELPLVVDFNFQEATKTITANEVSDAIRNDESKMSKDNSSKVAPKYVQLKGKLITKNGREYYFSNQILVPVPLVPQIIFSKFQYRSANLNPYSKSGAYAKFWLVLEMRNPNNFTLVLEKVSYQLIAKEKVIVNDTLSNIELEASSKKIMKIPTLFKGKDIITKIPKYRSYKKSDFFLTGELTISGKKEQVKFTSQEPDPNEKKIADDTDVTEKTEETNTIKEK